VTGVTRVGSALAVLALLALGLLGLGVLTPSTAAAAPGSYTVRIDGSSAAYLYIVCLKTTTTKQKYPAGGGDRVCSGKKGSTNGSFDLTAEYTAEDTVWIDFEMFVDLSGHSRTKDDIVITGARDCSVSGVLFAGKFECEDVLRKTSFTPPEIDPYTVNVADPKAPVVQLLNLMAWCVSAAAVLGLLVTGTTVAAQLRRGALEERTEYVRQITVVIMACLIATTAGPVVEWLALTE